MTAMHDDLPSLYAFNKWADSRVLHALQGLDEEQYTRELGGGWPSVRATFVHIAGATWAWSERIGGRDCTKLRTVDELPRLDDAAGVLHEAHARFDQIVASTTPARLNETFVWKNLSREEKKAPLWTILRHVVNHETYHRGQISSMIKRLGAKPIATDFVLWGIETFEKENS
jgi:uncharacterized damage-inducible protein DinB